MQGSDLFICNFKMKLALKILVSLLCASALLFALQALVGFGLKHNSNFKISYIQSHPINADLLAHGSCEIETTLDPTVIEKYLPYKTYNLALNHSDFADNYIHLYEYLKHQPAPKLALLYAIPESFDSSVTNTFNTYRFVYLVKDPVVKEVVAEMDPAYSRFSWLPFMNYSYYSNFVFYKALDGWLQFLSGNKTSRWPNGFNAPVFSNQRPSVKVDKEDRTPIFFHWSKSREKYFIKTIELLKAHGTKVLVYHSPIYFEALELQNNRHFAINKIDSICSAYNIPFLQFDSLPMRFDRKNYYNTINPTIPTYNTTLAGNSIFNNYFGRLLQDTLPAILNETNRTKTTTTEKESYLNKP